MLRKIRVAVLCSGGGTNLQAILDAQAAGKIPSGEIALVVSDNASAYALERAKAAGVATFVADKRQSRTAASGRRKFPPRSQKTASGWWCLRGL